MQPVARRLPAKRFALSFSSPCLARPRGCAGQFAHTCGEQVAHRVFFFPASRTHAVVSGCRLMPGFCFPGQGKTWLLFPAPGRKPAGQKPAPNIHEYVKRGATRSPTHRNARKAELCSLAFRAFPMPAGGLRPKGPRKPASSAPAAGKSRTVFVLSPSLARTRFIPGAYPRTAPVFPGQAESPTSCSLRQEKIRRRKPAPSS